MHPWFFYVVLQNSCTTVHCPCEYVRGIDDDDDDDVYLEEGNVFIISHSINVCIDILQYWWSSNSTIYICNTFNVWIFALNTPE